MEFIRQWEQRSEKEISLHVSGPEHRSQVAAYQKPGRLNTHPTSKTRSSCILKESFQNEMVQQL